MSRLIKCWPITGVNFKRLIASSRNPLPVAHNIYADLYVHGIMTSCNGLWRYCRIVVNRIVAACLRFSKRFEHERYFAARCTRQHTIRSMARVRANVSCHWKKIKAWRLFPLRYTLQFLSFFHHFSNIPSFLHNNKLCVLKKWNIYFSSDIFLSLSLSADCSERNLTQTFI